MYYKNRKLTKRAGVLQTLMSGGGAGAAPRSQGLGTQAASAMSQFSKNVSPKTRGYLKKVPFVGGFFRHKPISPEANLRYARMNSNLRQKRLDNYRENVQQNLAQMPTGFL
jgi:hypothetical protein